MCPAIETEDIRCPHCGEEAIDDDDLCRFCGKVIVPSGQVRKASSNVISSLQSLKGKIRPMTAEELDETLVSADYSNPANPIWDE